MAGNTDLAQRHAVAAVGVARELAGARTLVMALMRAAEAAVISGHPETAQQLLNELLATLRELGSPGWAAEALELTTIMIAPRQPAAAATLLGAAAALRDLLHEEGGVLIVLTDLLAACRREISTSLTEPDAVDAERTGATMHLAEVLAYARSQLRSTHGET